MAFEDLKGLNSSESWSVILQSYSPKLKKELAKKLSDIFGLEKRDAEQALANTPLILLDGLTFGMAARIKNFFVKVGAVAETTNHEMIKKNCYQIVWPAVPDLSFFLKDEVAAPSQQVSPTADRPVSAKETPAAAAMPEPKRSLFERLRDLDKKLDGETPSPAQPAVFPKPAPQPSGPLLPKIGPEAKGGQALEKEKDALTQRIAQLEQHIRELTDELGQKEGLLKDAEKALQAAHDRQHEPLEAQKELPSAAEELKGQVVRLEEMLAAKEKERASVQTSLLEWRAKAAELEQKLAAKSQAAVSPAAGQEPKRDEAAEKEKATLTQRIAQFERHIRELTDELAQRDNLLKQAEKALQVAHDRDNQSAEKIAILEKKISEKAASAGGAEASSAVEELQGQVVRLEEMLAAKEKERAAVQVSLLEWRTKASELEQKLSVHQTESSVAGTAALDEWKAKAAGLEQALSKIEKERTTSQSSAQQWEHEATNLRKTLAAKEEEWKNKEAHLENLQSSSAARSTELDSLKAEVAKFRAKENDLTAQSEALQRSLTELNNTLRSREELLKIRDEHITALEQRIAAAAAESRDFEKVRGEHAQFVKERATFRQEIEAKIAEQDARHAKSEEEGRRYRSRMERKVTAATRELGEWIRGVDALRQGLQKLTVFLSNDSTVQDPNKKTALRSLLNKPTTPPKSDPH